VLASSRPGPGGLLSFRLTLRDFVPGPRRYQVAFRPGSHAPAITSTVAVDVTSPPEYPFPRPAADRATSSADELAPFWADGAACSVGCRPDGAIDGWPLRPFHRQHALRAGFDEHRPSGFHYGIDIQARDGSPVYAIQPGRAHIIETAWPEARVQVGNYIYWHVKPAVREGQWVVPYRTVVGHVLRDLRHLHLSEVDASGRYVNPLRPGGRVLAPYADDEPPVIGAPAILPDGEATVQVFDPQSFRVRTSYLTPVLAPAAVAYRLWHADGTPDGPLEWAFRGSQNLLYQDLGQVFTPRAHEPGFLCFAERPLCRPLWEYRLAGGLAPRLDLARDHGERLTVYAWDWAGNTTARDVSL
jgi:hypothetical protein